LQVDPAWEVHPAQVQECLQKGREVLLLDVRQLKEWNVARIEGAQLIPMNELPARAAAELGDAKNKRVVVICHHGVRSLRATAFLRQMGFTDVHSLAGGIEAWSLIVDPSVPRY